MIVRQNTDRIWHGLVERKEIKGEYKEHKEDKKPKFEIGIENTPQGPVYYALDISSATPTRLPGQVIERVIDGTNFIIQFNEFRGYKPVSVGKRFPEPGAIICNFDCLGTGKANSIADRNPSGHFISINGNRYNLYHNAFPIEENGHFMYVPVERRGIKETIPHITQRLDKARIEDILDISASTENAVTFFNSLNAGASVDHLHFQQVNYKRNLKGGAPLPNNRFAIESAPVEEYRGRKFLADYPINGLVFDTPDVSQIWADINRFQDGGVPFNWVLMNEKSYLIPRKPRTGDLELPDTFASLENIGDVVTTNKNIFDSFNKSNLVEICGALSLDKDLILDVRPVRYGLFNYDPCNDCAERTMGVGGESCLGCPHAR